MLWQKYDHGGISVGRSLRCDLLDCYLDFTPLPRLRHGADGYYDGLEKEILSRPPVKPLIMLSIEEIQTYNKKELALAGLGALLALEFSFDADIAWKNGFELERKRIKDVLDRFSFIQIHESLNIEKVAKALLNRKSNIQYEKSLKVIQRIRISYNPT